MTTVDPLATPANLVALLGRELTADEETRAVGLLASASTRIRRYTRQDFTFVANDVQVLRGDGDTIRLPQRPVTAVTSVVAVGAGGLPDVPLAGWWFDGIDVVYLRGCAIVINLPEWWHEYPTDVYRVTNSHGYAEIPADVVDVCAGMVLRTLTAPTQAGGVRSETLGSYSYQLEAAGVGLTVRLSDEDKEILKDYRQKSSSIRMRLSR